VVTALAVALCAGCGASTPAAQMAKPPEYTPEGQTKCSVATSQARPLVVEWPSSDRAALEAKAKHGLVPVRYVGCEMEVLDRCDAPGKYGYVPITMKHDRVTVRSEDELYANLPIGAAKLEANLKTAGELNVAMTIVGRLESDRNLVNAKELSGQCARATHVIAALTVGAFDFYAGAEADVGGGASMMGAGGGGESRARHATLTNDGDDAACAKATRDDTGPPFNCSALLRVEVVPIQGRPGDAVLADSPTDLRAVMRQAQEAEDRDQLERVMERRGRPRLVVFGLGGIDQTVLATTGTMPPELTTAGVKMVEGRPGYAVGLGVGTRLGLLPVLEAQARASVTHAGGSADTEHVQGTSFTVDSGGMNVDRFAADVTLRARPTVASPLFFGAGGEAALLSASNSAQVGYTSSGTPPVHDHFSPQVAHGFLASGLVETGVVFGTREEWELGLRGFLGLFGDAIAGGGSAFRILFCAGYAIF
jgi:hypothetical protein